MIEVVEEGKQGGGKEKTPKRKLIFFLHFLKNKKVFIQDPNSKKFFGPFIVMGKKRRVFVKRQTESSGGAF